jgi:hypothetical protein
VVGKNGGMPVLKKIISESTGNQLSPFSPQ